MPEISWDADGKYCGDEDVHHPEQAPELSVTHSHSGGCPDISRLWFDDTRECGRFICEACKRVVPWCFGGCDDSLCDDCWSGRYWTKVSENKMDSRCASC